MSTFVKILTDEEIKKEKQEYDPNVYELKHPSAKALLREMVNNVGIIIVNYPDPSAMVAASALEYCLTMPLGDDEPYTNIVGAGTTLQIALLNFINDIQRTYAVCVNTDTVDPFVFVSELNPLKRITTDQLDQEELNLSN